jgi:hypothetical protein
MKNKNKAHEKGLQVGDGQNKQNKTHQRGLMFEEEVQRDGRTSARFGRLYVRVSRDCAIAWMLLTNTGLMEQLYTIVQLFSYFNL